MFANQLVIKNLNLRMISRLPGVHLKKIYFTAIWEKHFIGGIAFHKNKSLVS